jgi:uncharacterized protein (TIGR02996 family)
MTQDDAFLHAILEQPDDDAPRLVYADWLDEHGDAARAELIRLQCRTAQRYKDWVYATGDAESEREDALLKQYGERWAKDLPSLKGLRWRFWRGMPGHVWVAGWPVFRKHAARIFDLAPVEFVTFGSLSVVGARTLAHFASLARLRGLSLAYAIRNVRALEALLQSPHLRNLITFDVHKCDVGDRGAVAFANCPHLKNLQLLRLDSNEITDTGALALARSPHLAHLEQLELSRNQISDEAAAALRATFGDVNV